MSGFVVQVPAIGDFEDVEVIEVLVAAGDRVEVEQSLVTLESEKATMEIPCPRAGVVRALSVEVGSRVSEGSPLLELDVEDAPAEVEDVPAETAQARAAVPVGAAELPSADLHAGVLVLGAGPGGYTAAFRAADLGADVVLVERYPTLGGVCLNVGCIPSKALLHMAEVAIEARELSRHGIEFGEPRIYVDKVRARKDAVVKRLTDGLAGLAKRRRVRVVEGRGRFEGPHLLRVEGPEGERTIAFEHAIVAVGSRSAHLPGVPEGDLRVMDSTRALELDEIPGRLLVVGGGIIGLEMAAVYHALGARVTVVEILDRLMAGADADLVAPLEKIVRQRYENVFLGTKVTGVDVRKHGVHVSFEGADAPGSDRFDRVLVAIGRRPNGGEIDADRAGIAVDERGFIAVDAQQRTNVPHVFAIGDVVGEPMLAHKASAEAVVAAEVIAGHKVRFEARAIPSVAYTDPEVAWMGLTEEEAQREGREVRIGRFPWAASGRALGIGRDEGQTKLIFDAETGRLLGAGMVGPGAGELVAETVLALELGADAQDLSLSIHPHPTLSETVRFAAEVAAGTVTDLYVPKKRAR